MSFRVDIGNIALSMLGAEPITSFEDDSPEAIALKIHYPIARDATLESAEWSFAIRRFTPPKSNTPPVWGFSSAFPIPSDILRVLQVDRDFSTAFTTQRDEGRRNQIFHVIEGREILCDEEAIFCTGIRRVEDEGIYSNLFAQAFAAQLAILTAYMLTESNSKFQAVAAIYAGLIKQARARDGQQGSTRRLRSNWLRRVR